MDTERIKPSSRVYQGDGGVEVSPKAAGSRVGGTKSAALRAVDTLTLQQVVDLLKAGHRY